MQYAKTKNILQKAIDASDDYKESGQLAQDISDRMQGNTKGFKIGNETGVQFGKGQTSSITPEMIKVNTDIIDEIAKTKSLDVKKLAKKFDMSLKDMNQKLSNFTRAYYKNRIGEGGVYLNKYNDRVLSDVLGKLNASDFKNQYERTMTELVSQAYPKGSKNLTAAIDNVKNYHKINLLIAEKFPSLYSTLDHSVPYTYIRDITEVGGNPKNLIKVRPLPKDANTFKTLIDRRSIDLGKKLKANPKDAELLKDFKNLNSIKKQIPLEFGTTTSGGKVVSYANQALSGKTDLVDGIVKGNIQFNELIDFSKNLDPESDLAKLLTKSEKKQLNKISTTTKVTDKELMDYITDRTGKVKQPMFSSGLSGAYEMLSDDLKKIVNSEGFKTFKAKIANPALKTAVSAAKLPTKVFGAADLVLGYLDYTNNRQKGFSKEDSTRHMVDAVLFGATSFGKKGDIKGVREIANKNGMSNEVFDNLVNVNLNQKKMIDRINKSKAEFNESMDIIESKTSDPLTEKLRIQKLKVDTKEFLTNTMKDIVDDSRSLNTNLQVQEAGAPIDINVDNQKAFKDLGSSSREFVQNRIDASDPKVFEQGDTTMGKIGSIIKETVMQPDYYTGFFKQTKAQKDRKDMEKLKIQDPTLYYKMLMSEGVDPRIKLNIPVQLEFEQNNPEFGTQYSDSLTQNKAEGGIIGLRSKYEYKK